MPIGDCFRCHQPGHWANNCPLKTFTNHHAPPLPAADAAPPPTIDCKCGGGACKVFTSRTEKNPNKKFYKCPKVPSCGFFKWCAEVRSIVESEPISVNPTCPCGAGPCRRETVTGGPDAHRSYFVCCIKKGFGACGFFQWEDEDVVAHIPSQPEEEVGIGDSPCSTLIGFSDFGSADDENSITLSNDEGNRVFDGIAQPLEDALPITVGKESILGCSSFNNLESVSTSAYDKNQGSCSSLVDLIEQYYSEKLHFESVSTKYVDALTAFTGSYKQLATLRKRLLGVENQVKIYEAETSEFATSLQQVSGEMVKSQKKMVETAMKIAKEVRVHKK